MRPRKILPNQRLRKPASPTSSSKAASAACQCAGLAMSTMDIIKHFGGEPANFSMWERGECRTVAAAIRIITADPNVKGIFVNIFGGIMKCDTIRGGDHRWVNEVGLSVPMVVRLEGTNVELGKRMLDESGLNLTTAVDMKDGAQRIVELAG